MSKYESIPELRQVNPIGTVEILSGTGLRVSLWSNEDPDGLMEAETSTANGIAETLLEYTGVRCEDNSLQFLCSLAARIAMRRVASAPGFTIQSGPYGGTDVDLRPLGERRKFIPSIAEKVEEQ